MMLVFSLTFLLPIICRSVTSLDAVQYLNDFSCVTFRSPFYFLPHTYCCDLGIWALILSPVNIFLCHCADGTQLILSSGESWLTREFSSHCFHTWTGRLMFLWSHAVSHYCKHVHTQVFPNEIFSSWTIGMVLQPALFSCCFWYSTTHQHRP